MNAIISNGNYTARVQLPVERRQLAGALSYLHAIHASAYDIKYNEESDKGLTFTLECHGIVENAIAKALPTGFRFHTLNDTIALMHNLPYTSRREFENTVKVEGLASYEQLNRMLTEAYPQSVTTKYYCPLTIQVHSRDSYGDIDEDGYEEDAAFAARHEDDRVSIVPIIQSLAQLEKNYGKEGAEIIVDNTQLTVFGGFAPNSETAQVLSKSLGSRTVLSGSVSQSKNDPSRSLQMIERPLMTADELKALPKGTFVVTKTGFNPIQVKLKLFFKWGIQFEKEPYVVPLRDNKNIYYASKDALMRAAYDKYTKDKNNPEDEIPEGSYSVEQVLGEKNYPPSNRSARQHHAAKLSETPNPEETA